MRKKISFLGILFLLFSGLNAQTPYYFYNYVGERIYLSLDTEHAFLSLKEQKLPVGIEQSKIKTTALQSDNSNRKQYRMRKGTSRFWTELSFEEKLSDEQYLEKLSDIKRQNKDVIVSPYFKINENDDDKIGLSNFFYVKLKNSEDTTLLRQMAEQKECIIIEQDTFMPLWFTLSVTSASKYNALEVSNILYESGLFQSAEPNLMPENILACANDTYFMDQWGLNNTGQYGGTNGIDIKACDAWQISTGTNVTVAVIDQGIDFTHPDLQNNIHPLSYDAQKGLSPSVIRGGHGTTCAGIIGAIQNNSAGISGVAPDCQLMSISHSLTILHNVQQLLAAGINWAWQNGADVISNSWGHPLFQGAYITDAVDNAVNLGRGGKGCVVVFSSGNSGASVIYPARLPNVIAVGAIHRSGNKADFSSYGTELDVVAPGVDIPTTDLQGDEGYNYDTDSVSDLAYSDYTNKDYTGKFDGTSSACPHVSGVAALILSVNPYLTGQQIRDIIESTAQKVGGYDYQPTSDHPNGIWHEEMGYGLIDAYAAVQLAKCYTGLPIVQDTILQNITWSTPVQATGTITIPNGVTLTITSEVKFEDNAEIIVHPGGKLVVNGGVLTNACPNTLWKGITVVGTSGTPQNEQTQGSVILTNATIENALIAVDAALIKSNGNGGIIRATNTNFINNLQAIDYGSYENKDLNGTIADNLGVFTRCTFSVDANNYFAANGKTFVQHVKLNRVRGIKFYGCRFDNMTQASSSLFHASGKGIYAQDAGFRVMPSCMKITPCGECSPNQMHPAIFSGLLTAIDVNNSGNTYDVYIDQCDFKDVATAANIKSVPNFRFTRNNIINFTGYGLICESSSGYKIEQNRFEGAAGYSTSGLTVKNSSTAPNLLYRNSFKNVRRAISVSGNNFNSLNQTGLLIKCNTFEDSYRDMELQANATINVNQGSLLEGADNCFNRTLNSSLYVTTPFGLTYFHSNAPCHVPVKPVNVGLIINTASANKCQSTLCSPTTDLEIISSHEEYLLMQQEYDALLKEYETGGYAPLLQNLNSSGEYSEQEMAALQFSAKMSELSNRMRELSDNAISIILQDSVLNTDLLKEWYSVVRTPFAKYALAETHLFTGSYAEADATLRHIPAQFALSEFEQTEYDTYMQFHSFRKELQFSGREWSELKEDEIAALQAIAEEDAGRGSAMAKGVLCFFYGICYEDEIPKDMPEQVPPSMTKATPHPDETLPETSTVSVYPNPFGTEITVMVNSPETVITRVELYDAFGNNILHQAVHQMQKTVSTGNISTGIYVLKTYLSNGAVDVQRVIKN